MSTVQVTLPDALKAFVDEQVAARGYASAGEFLQSLIEAEKHRSLRAEIESLLLQRVEGPFTDLTNADYEAIRREGRRIIAERRAP